MRERSKIRYKFLQPINSFSKKDFMKLHFSPRLFPTLSLKHFMENRKGTLTDGT
jgi:hypothetical protein